MPETGSFFRGMAGCTRMQYNCKKETTGMDTFEKIRALLAEQLDVDPAKITLESDIMSDFEASRFRKFGKKRRAVTLQASW